MSARHYPVAAAREAARQLADSEGHAAVRADERFPDHVRGAIAVWGGGEGDDAAFTRTLRDSGRFAAGMWAIYLHDTPGGLTLTRMSALLDETGLAGPGRARAMMMFLRFVGYIEPMPKPLDAKLKPFRPTAQLVMAVRERVKREMSIYRIREDAVAALVARVGETAFLDRVTLAYAEAAIAMVNKVPQQGVNLGVISHRYAGMSILCHVLEAGIDAQGRYPPTDPIRFSMSALAARNGVSRTQLRHVFIAGAEAGFFANPGNGEVTVTPLLIEHFELLVAATAMIADFGISQALSADYPDVTA